MAPAEASLFRIDIIGTKLNRRHVEYLTSRRFERLSINQQKRSADLIDNSKAKCRERAAAGGVYHGAEGGEMERRKRESKRGRETNR